MERRSKPNKLLCVSFCVGRDMRSKRSVISGNVRSLAIFPMSHTPAVSQQYIAKQKKILGNRSRFLRYSFIAFKVFFTVKFLYNIYPDWFPFKLSY